MSLRQKAGLLRFPDVEAGSAPAVHKRQTKFSGFRKSQKFVFALEFQSLQESGLQAAPTPLRLDLSCFIF